MSGTGDGESRFEPLFQYTNDRIALVEYRDGSPVIEAANPRFREVFGPEQGTVIGRGLNDIIESGDCVDEARELSHQFYDNQILRHEITHETEEGTRNFYCQVIPAEASETGTIERAFVIYTDVTDQKRRERELQERNERLTEFAGIVSHDLRNPLEVAQIRLDLVQEECETEHLATVEHALNRMETLISDVLTWAREGGEIEEVEIVELAEAVKSCWRDVETPDASLSIQTERSIVADGSRLRQLLENLIRNAIDHGGEGVSVTIGDLEGGFYVEDNGPGIPEGASEQVFEVGYSTRDEGTGFGLNIVREIADAHGWEIEVTEGTAGGARFEFTGVERPD